MLSCSRHMDIEALPPRRPPLACVLFDYAVAGGSSPGAGGAAVHRDRCQGNKMLSDTTRKYKATKEWIYNLSMIQEHGGCAGAACGREIDTMMGLVEMSAPDSDEDEATFGKHWKPPPVTLSIASEHSL
ncbi:hypothetical protein U9M48_044742 [Paspalum notatum var. saurae]|uniref:Uncharacterized protein n=1 Tax=Paspalum notatum var. saurae TaxID=547442 RepID=A0AAQ3XIV5_PASNO